MESERQMATLKNQAIGSATRSRKGYSETVDDVTVIATWKSDDRRKEGGYFRLSYVIGVVAGETEERAVEALEKAAADRKREVEVAGTAFLYANDGNEEKLLADYLREFGVSPRTIWEVREAAEGRGSVESALARFRAERKLEAGTRSADEILEDVAEFIQAYVSKMVDSQGLDLWEDFSDLWKEIGNRNAINRARSGK